MIVVALIIIAVCAVIILGAVLGDPSEVIELGLFDLWSAEVTSIGAFLIGLGTGVLTLLGLWLLVAGSRRARHRSAERRAMEERHDQLEREKAELESKLGRDRSSTRMAPEPATSSSSPAPTTSVPPQTSTASAPSPPPTGTSPPPTHRITPTTAPPPTTTTPLQPGASGDPRPAPSVPPRQDPDPR